MLHQLYEILQREKPWVWSDQCEDAFCVIKALITSPEVMTHYNSNLPIHLPCDASPVRLRAVLSHMMDDRVERLIAYVSRSLTKAEINYSQIDKEALALIWGVKRFQLNLFGREFNPLASVFHQLVQQYGCRDAHYFWLVTIIRLNTRILKCMEMQIVFHVRQLTVVT